MLILLLLGIFAETILLDPGFYISRLNSTDYFDEIGREIDYGFLNLSMMTTIPLEVFEETVSGTAIVEMGNANIYQAMNYMRYKSDKLDDALDLETVKRPLYRFIEEYSSENEIELDDTQWALIDEAAEDAAAIITNHTVLFNINAVKKYNEFQSFRLAVYFFCRYWYFFLLACIACVILLAVLNFRRLRRVYLWAGSSAIAASLMVTIPAAMALIYRIPYRFNIGTYYLKKALETFALGYINYFLYSGITLFILGTISLLAYLHLSKKASERRHSRYNLDA